MLGVVAPYCNYYSIDTGRTERKADMMMRFPPGASLERQLDTGAIGLGDLADITVTNDEPDTLGQFDVSAHVPTGFI